MLQKQINHLIFGFLFLLSCNAIGKQQTSFKDVFFDYPGVSAAISALEEKSITFVFDEKNESETCKGTMFAGMFYPLKDEGILVLCNKSNSIESLVHLVFEHEMAHAVQWCNAKKINIINPMGYQINNYGIMNTIGRTDINGKTLFIVEAEADSMAFDLSLKQIINKLNKACSE